MWHFKAIFSLLWWSGTKSAVSPRSACGKPIANDRKSNSTTQGKTAQQEKRNGLLTHAITQWKCCAEQKKADRAHTVWFCSYKTLIKTVNLISNDQNRIVGGLGQRQWWLTETRYKGTFGDAGNIPYLDSVVGYTGNHRYVKTHQNIHMHTTVHKLNLNKT